MYIFKKLNSVIQKYLPNEQIELIKKAYIIARDAHKGQIRSSGEVYITHPIAVACILAEMHIEYETLMAALLHDIIEDTKLTFNDIEKLLGTTTAILVESVSKLDKLNFRNKKEAQAENLRKIIISMIKDTRVILIKLADRMHNMRTLDSLRTDKQRRIARETLEIYSPLAHRLGINYIKTELEELGFKTLYPKRYRILKKIVKTSQNIRKDTIQKIFSEINDWLITVEIKFRISVYEKSIYSIYRKIQQKEHKFYSIMDIYAFLVIVQDIDTCYRILGKIHGLYRPRPGRIKDYIAIPKANGYQALHTSLIGPKGVQIEIQICTEYMNQIAEIGIAANWIYKKQIEKNSITQLRTRRWMQNILDLQQSTENSFEFIESIKSDLFPDEIYVFTPKGHIIELPTGSTPVDFAYAVHTDIGHTCIAARVDYQSYPLSQSLSSGQTIEIITGQESKPNAAWLNFVVSSKARTKIRHLLKNLKREDSINLGRRLLKHALGANKKLSDIPKINIETELARMKLNSIDDLLLEIGLGNAISVVIARNLKNNSKILLKNNNKFTIKNTKDIFITFYNKHINVNEPIISSIINNGLLIQYNNYNSFFKKEEDKITIEYKYDINAYFFAEIKVDLINHQGALANLTAAINKTNSSINRMNSEKKNDHIYCVLIQLIIKNRIQLADVMRKIRILPDVLRISRKRN
ncbi:Bifunctional (p)ppGpp synthase/hydrolase SpoT [Candidatus Providencia siddallii]|uniref:guanosine-3',5'-bis(diphosphate) 3'-diphosphatase n=1 Tax=Candidatus Providencia siddallii TaxID=1715285 RepID=A0A0M6W7J1_9GAMM|nr:Bifunctional (p)ppGpp synthase/hydrolase SpoT [Candidatus Providencia siddallii]